MKITDILAAETIDTIKAKIIGYAQTAKLKVNTWLKGDPSQAWLAVFAQGIFMFEAAIRDALRSQFLEFATDPGDDDPTVPQKKGWLSWKGEGDYYTFRISATFANGKVTLTNNGSTPQSFGPDELTFQNSATTKTYRNSYDPALYPEPHRSLTLNAGASVEIPVLAEEIGTASNAAPGEVDTLVSVLIGVTVANDSPILGSDRESRASYVARCRLQAASTSPNGPADAYRYIATTANRDGTIGGEDKERVNINRVFVTRNSMFGLVDVWIASPAGAPDPSDFAIVDALITQYAVPDCVTYTGHMATETTVSITYTVEATSSAGVDADDIKAAVLARLPDFFRTIPIGGYKNTGLGGKLYLSRLRAEIGKAHPLIFDVTVSLPAGDTNIANGAVPILGLVTGTVNFSS